FKDYSVNGLLNFILYDDQTLNFNYQMFKAENVGIPGGASLFPSIADVRYPVEKRDLFSAGYEIKNLSTLVNKISINYSYQNILRSVENIPYIVQNVAASNGQPAKRVSVLKITPGANHYYNGVLMKALLLTGENNTINTGIDLWERKYSGERQKYQMIEVLDAAGNTVNTINKVIVEKPLPDSRFRNIGFFAQDDYGIIPDKLSLSFGARIDKITVTGQATKNPYYEITNGVFNATPANQKTVWDNSTASDISYSSNAGILYSLTKKLNLTFSLGYSFRSPSLEERFQYIDLGNLVRIGNPFLKSEICRSADFGVRYYSSDLKIISSIFYNQFSELVVERPGVFEGIAALIKDNAGKARLYGFDISIDYSFANLLIFSNASFVKGDELSIGGNLPEIPPLNGIIGLKYNFMENYSAGINSEIFAAQNSVALGESATPGYVVFNLELTAKRINFGAVNFALSGGVENIFDRLYRNHLSSARGGLAIEPGINIYLKIITNW
ncbi:MAG: TonB-dependent receptor, partial [Ignavibacteriaceae bacterium]|nr:TonB-dependent receptor [Ignavibacteriaceae bacterium]